MSSPTQPPDPIRVQTRFERFPASIKGAFVMAGTDGNPHAVRIESARMLRIPDGPAKPVPVEDRLLDVAPARDLFVPFEVGVADMEPGWYRLESSVRVDAGRMWDFEGRPFTIPWPRNDVRRGIHELGRTVGVGGASFVIDRVELGPDAAVVVWRTKPRARGKDVAEPLADAILMADGTEVPRVPPVPGMRLFEPRVPGERRTVSYPILRETRTLHVAMRVRPGDSRSEPLVVSLA